MSHVSIAGCIMSVSVLRRYIPVHVGLLILVICMYQPTYLRFSNYIGVKADDSCHHHLVQCVMIKCLVNKCIFYVTYMMICMY